ncbi:hypothetical protein EJ02DRAFT_431141 [Clathrospora elynae]|uniref:Uncharacterized protein n=1 Tax=Clathrospora elynae TaxID=706981 RepID=A0A6A5T128_9PLEO|nr:hypothetical protein EJ02DRAFT_431141 [Clathrospora elynae]
MLERTVLNNGNTYLRQGRLHYATLDYSVKNDVLQDLVQITVTHPDFERMILKEYNPDVKVAASSNDKTHSEDENGDSSDSDESTEELVPRPPLYTKETYEKFDHMNRFILADVAKWICEAKFLRIMGMPTASFSLVLAAIWHESVKEFARRQQFEFLQYRHDAVDDFIDVIKQMLRGEIPARFDADMGELWDIEKVLREHEGDWPRSIGHVVELGDFDEPDGG